MSNVIEFRPVPRRVKSDRRIKINLNYMQLATLDAEALRRGCSRSAVIGSLLADMVDRRKQARS